MNTCAICKGTRSLFTLDIPADDDSGETFERQVCGSCWEVIAVIANRRMTTRLDAMDEQIAALLAAMPSAGTKERTS